MSLKIGRDFRRALEFVIASVLKLHENVGELAGRKIQGSDIDGVELTTERFCLAMAENLYAASRAKLMTDVALAIFQAHTDVRSVQDTSVTIYTEDTTLCPDNLLLAANVSSHPSCRSDP